MYCPFCGTDNSEGRKFCLACGTPLEEEHKLNSSQIALKLKIVKNDAGSQNTQQNTSLQTSAKPRQLADIKPPIEQKSQMPEIKQVNKPVTPNLVKSETANKKVVTPVINSKRAEVKPSQTKTEANLTREISKPAQLLPNEQIKSDSVKLAEGNKNEVVKNDNKSSSHKVDRPLMVLRNDLAKEKPKVQADNLPPKAHSVARAQMATIPETKVVSAVNQGITPDKVHAVSRIQIEGDHNEPEQELDVFDASKLYKNLPVPNKKQEEVKIIPEKPAGEAKNVEQAKSPEVSVKSIPSTDNKKNEIITEPSNKQTLSFKKEISLLEDQAKKMGSKQTALSEDLSQKVKTDLLKENSLDNVQKLTLKEQSFVDKEQHEAAKPTTTKGILLGEGEYFDDKSDGRGHKRNLKIVLIFGISWILLVTIAAVIFAMLNANENVDGTLSRPTTEVVIINDVSDLKAKFADGKMKVSWVPSSNSVKIVDQLLEIYDTEDGNLLKQLNVGAEVFSYELTEGFEIGKDYRIVLKLKSDNGSESGGKSVFVSVAGDYDKLRKQDLEDLKAALENYLDQKGTYPKSKNYASLLNTLIKEKLITRRIKDPEYPEHEYLYKSMWDGQSYELKIYLSNVEDELFGGQKSPDQIYTYSPVKKNNEPKLL